MRASIRTFGGLFLGLAAAALLTACETPLDRAYGLSYRAYVAETIQNPDAGLEDREAPPTGGPSTEAALSKHRRAEQQAQEAAPPSIINVDIGG